MCGNSYNTSVWLDMANGVVSDVLRQALQASPAEEYSTYPETYAQDYDVLYAYYGTTVANVNDMNCPRQCLQEEDTLDETCAPSWHCMAYWLSGALEEHGSERAQAEPSVWLPESAIDQLDLESFYYWLGPEFFTDNAAYMDTY